MTKRRRHRYTSAKLRRLDLGGGIGGGIGQFAESGSFFGEGKDYGIPSGYVDNQWSAEGRQNFNYAKTAASAIGGLGGVAAGMTGGTLAQDTTTQQAFDQLASVIPFYSVGNMLGDLAATDYKNISLDTENPDTFGMLTDPGRYDVASTIGWFLGPDNLISGLSGEGWTAKQRREKIEERYAPQRNALIRQRDARVDKERRERNPGNFYDTNQLLNAAYGGQIGQSNRGGLTDYQTGQKHGESELDGIPVDNEGNPSANSNMPAVALTAKGEVTYDSYVYSDELFI